MIEAEAAPAVDEVDDRAADLPCPERQGIDPAVRIGDLRAPVLVHVRPHGQFGPDQAQDVRLLVGIGVEQFLLHTERVERDSSKRRNPKNSSAVAWSRLEAWKAMDWRELSRASMSDHASCTSSVRLQVTVCHRPTVTGTSTTAVVPFRVTARRSTSARRR